MTLSGDRSYAGFWLRLWASMIDTLCLGLLLLPLLLWFYGLQYFSDRSGWFHGPFDALVQMVLPFALVLWCWKKWLATPGKMLFAAEIVDAQTGRAPSGRQLALRYFGYFVALLPLGLGFLWIAWDPRKQGFHDKLAGTVVTRTSSRLSGGRRQWLLALSMATLLFTVGLTGGALVWILGNKARIRTTIAGLRGASEQGLFYGLGINDEDCLKRALAEMSDCPGLLCGYEASLFLNGCLQSSSVTREFCHEVPTGWTDILGGRWQRDQCTLLNQSSFGCRQFFSTQMLYCQQILSREID